MYKEVSAVGNNGRVVGGKDHLVTTAQNIKKDTKGQHG